MIGPKSSSNWDIKDLGAYKCLTPGENKSGGEGPWYARNELVWSAFAFFRCASAERRPERTNICSGFDMVLSRATLAHTEKNNEEGI